MDSDAAAGASTQRQYELRRSREAAHRRATWRLGLRLVIGLGVAAYFATLAGVHLLNGWLHSGALLRPAVGKVKTTGPKAAIGGSEEQLLAVVLGVAAAAAVVSELWGPRAATESWGIGAVGERRTARHLAPLESHGFVFLHDRRMPGGRGNIDHVVVGPTGVFTVESKNYGGRVLLGRRSIRHNGRRIDNVLDQAAQQAEAVQRVMGDRLVSLDVEVLPIVCIHRATVERPLFQGPTVQGVRICSRRRLAGMIKDRPVRLSSHDVVALAAILDSSLAPALAVTPPRSTRTAQPVRGGGPGACSCGGHYVLRHRRSDGAAFYGCSRFPKCHHTRPP